MLQQDLQPEQDQDGSACEFCLCLVARAEYISNPHADGGEDESRGSDKGDR